MHTYLPTSSSYSGYPPFCMAFVDTNHYVVLHFKKVNGSIPAPPIDGWWLRKSSSRNKNLWLQSLENDLKLFQKLIPSSILKDKTKSVQKATPTYYVNLIATRSKKWDMSDDNGSTVFTTKSEIQRSGERQH
ncbi:hypothetical protein PPACK8108_LOCUS22108 [Phakopsora pachyrhizi]|uniref:Uncharacterized protein n=1 Tax=Phakopsora pachyrhizi TaxID=170000 RepID=A0AAV0BLL0_PHAPC|nr:hypothetical protein PPACK8108_LOCUS22108 [Phakopsora pachyrhizi]